MADASAGVDIVVPEPSAHELLHEERLLVGTPRRRDPADRVLALLPLDPLQLTRGVGDRLVPGHLAPRIRDLRADHRAQNAVGMGRVAPCEAALDARMAVVRLPALVRDHADDL